MIDVSYLDYRDKAFIYYNIRIFDERLQNIFIPHKKEFADDAGKDMMNCELNQINDASKLNNELIKKMPRAKYYLDKLNNNHWDTGINIIHNLRIFYDFLIEYINNPISNPNSRTSDYFSILKDFFYYNFSYYTQAYDIGKCVTYNYEYNKLGAKCINLSNFFQYLCKPAIINKLSDSLTIYMIYELIGVTDINSKEYKALPLYLSIMHDYLYSDIYNILKDLTNKRIDIVDTIINSSDLIIDDKIILNDNMEPRIISEMPEEIQNKYKYLYNITPEFIKNYYYNKIDNITFMINPKKVECLRYYYSNEPTEDNKNDVFYKVINTADSFRTILVHQGIYYLLFEDASKPQILYGIPLDAYYNYSDEHKLYMTEFNKTLDKYEYKISLN